ncbi:competence type IV pilus minor pilin ComGE [Streptococcus jiangjianxini]|uniref:competence type IV pilus minor pilin ComGE n=1 Tax=Streptococcus jiangjianxini TaxID=3161189 RepID=UPI0032EFB94E
MVNIKRKKIRAYILWESLLATAILASLASLLLGQLNYHQRQLRDLDNQAQALSVAIMAVQTHQKHLQKNGQDITISQFGTETVIKSKGKDIFRVKKLSP